MKYPKGAQAPFFLADGLQIPRLRDDGLLKQALVVCERGHFADALTATEYVCRRMPGSAVPAMLRANIVQNCLPGLAPKAWYWAWYVEPENPALQDAMLKSWLASGAAESAAEMARPFLVGRFQSGQQSGLVDILRQCGVDIVGVCWKSGNDIVGAVINLMTDPGETNAPAEELVVNLSDGESDFQFVVRTNGALFRLSPPAPSGVWSLSFQFQGPHGTTRQSLEGSPLVWGMQQDIAEHPQALPTLGEYSPNKLIPAQGVDIIIPVYSDFAGVKACLTSVIRSLPQNNSICRLIVIDDQSPDPALRVWLNDLARQGTITLLENKVNLGFIESVNRGLNIGSDNDALLLNADTLVNGDWVDRLCAALNRAPDIASVMPWSNNGETASFPSISVASPAPDAAQLGAIDAIASALHGAGELTDVEVPSSCGFAMLMRRTVIRQIGTLDGAAYTRGYLEEVDWCMRARAHGYRHSLATGVFVAHAGSSSFRVEKRLRVHQNRKILALRYPHYYPEHWQFVRSDPVKPARTALMRQLKQQQISWVMDLLAKESSKYQIPNTLPIALPSAYRRICVWQHKLGSAYTAKVLALARAIATQHASAVRLLIVGDVSEALWHTGVVEAIPPTGSYAQTPLADTAMVGISNCQVVLTEHVQAAPDHLTVVKLDDGFSPQSWLEGWMQQHQPQEKLSHKLTQSAKVAH
jgi:GT2 family glycosyltransferase